MTTTPHPTADPPRLQALNAQCRKFELACRWQAWSAGASMVVAGAWFLAALASAWFGDADVLLTTGAIGALVFAVGSGLTLLFGWRRRQLFRDIRRRAAGLSRAGLLVYKRADVPRLGAFQRGSAPAGRVVLQLEKLGADGFEALLADRLEPAQPGGTPRPGARDAGRSKTLAAR
ncbi:hypothetical protein [Piscinibacter koreensis]|uniref:Uncharacterized protein n=1 Tax=Piscinibacter koreensis TaxID=2742824 RepID=A0A7Y6NM60_9BURK|nr:hypothetical protein [Schlegelella koreensis]NUZ05743.1 hypothetical protein [Schlegelella koreensis]